MSDIPQLVLSHALQVDTKNEYDKVSCCTVGISCMARVCLDICMWAWCAYACAAHGRCRDLDSCPASHDCTVSHVLHIRMQVIQETEAAYLKILESSQTLLTVLKRESINIQKKKQAAT